MERDNGVKVSPSGETAMPVTLCMTSRSGLPSTGHCIIANLITGLALLFPLPSQGCKEKIQGGTWQGNEWEPGVPHPMGLKQWESTASDAQLIQHHRGPFPQKRILESHHRKLSLLLNYKCFTSETVKLLEENLQDDETERGFWGEETKANKWKYSKRQGLLWGKGHHKDITYKTETICKPFI